MIVNLFKHGGRTQRVPMLTISLSPRPRKRGVNYDHPETALEQIREWLASHQIDVLPITEEERTP